MLERSYRFFWRHKGDVYHVLWDLCRCFWSPAAAAPAWKICDDHAWQRQKAFHATESSRLACHQEGIEH